jgi:phage gp29-like protein
LTPDNTSLVTSERIERAVQLRYSPFPELSMQLLTQQLNQFRIGELRAPARTFEIMMERDGELSTPADKYFFDVARLPWIIEKDDDSKEAQQDSELLHYFYTHLTATSVLDQDEIGGLNLLLRQLMTAQAYRYSVHEMLLKINNAAKREITAEFRHCPVWFFHARKGRLAFMREEGDYEGIRLERGRWLSAVGRGLMRQCSIGYAVKHFPLRDWLFYCTRFGIPGIQGKTDAPKDSDEWKQFAAALTDFANRWITITGKNAEISLIEAAKGATALPFKDLVERTDRLYARSFRGGDLSTASREGDSVGASLQNEEKDVFLEYGAQWSTDVCNARIDEPLIEYAFNRAPKAWFKVTVPRQPETEAKTKAMGFLADRGGRVAITTAHEQLQIPVAEEGEDVLSAAKQPNTPGDGTGAGAREREHKSGG